MKCTTTIQSSGQVYLFLM